MYYNGYSWEISLGRFGLYLIGIIKNFLVIPHLDLIISFILLGLINVLLINLFKIENKVITTILIVTTPIISSTLLFYYCSIGYLIAFLLSISSIYLYYNEKNKLIKYLIPIIFIVIALSMYQAYFSTLVTCFILYNIKLLLNDKYKIKELIIAIIGMIIGLISYFILMKLSQLVFHIDMSSYSNANKLDLSLIATIPSKIITSYKYFYQFYFTNTFTKNTYLYNHIINFFILVIGSINIIYNTIKSKINIKNKVFIIILYLLLPIFVNSIIFIIPTSKLQLLMSTSYLLIFIFLLSFNYNKIVKIILILLLIVLIRNYIIQDEATYLTLENTFNKYNTIIDSVISNNLNNLDNEFMIVGNINVEDNNLFKIKDLNYGFISDEGIFWDDYSNSKNGFIRFMYEYKGLTINYVDEDKYNYLLNNIEYKTMTEYSKIIDNVIVIDFNK
jgi:hypothetical protein